MDLQPTPQRSRPFLARIRSATLWIILIGTLGYLVGVRVWGDMPYQSRNLRSTVAILISSFCLLLWWMFLSGKSWRKRWLGFAAFACFVGVLALVFRYEGVSGDLLPQFAFRWSSRPAVHSLNVPLPVPATPATNEVQLPPWADLATQTNRLNFPQFLGPLRNGELMGMVLETDWDKHSPQVVWRATVGEAWSGFAVVGDLAVTQEQIGADEAVVARHLKTGAQLWVHSDPVKYENPIAGVGPRATPTIVSDRVITMGGTGLLTCLDLSGRKIWQRDMQLEHGAKIPDWGFTSAPLVMGDRVVVSVGARPGKSLVAHRLSDGSVAWTSGDGHAGFSAPVLLDVAGHPMVIIFNDTALFGHEPSDGKILWQHPWPGGHPHVAVPALWKPDRLLVSSGYGTGSQLVQIHPPESGKSEWKAERLWKTTRFRNKFSNPVIRGGYAYGLDDGVLACLELETGELKWKGERHGHGQVLLIGEVLLVTAETGEVLLYAVTPEAPRLLAKYGAVEGKTWNPPAVAGDMLLIRNASAAVCLKIPLRTIP